MVYNAVRAPAACSEQSASCAASCMCTQAAPHLLGGVQRWVGEVYEARLYLRQGWIAGTGEVGTFSSCHKHPCCMAAECSRTAVSPLAEAPSPPGTMRPVPLLPLLQGSGPAAEQLPAASCGCGSSMQRARIQPVGGWLRAAAAASLGQQPTAGGSWRQPVRCCPCMRLQGRAGGGAAGGGAEQSRELARCSW